MFLFKNSCAKLWDFFSKSLSNGCIIDKVSILSSYLIFYKWFNANSALLSKSLLKFNYSPAFCFSFNASLLYNVESNPIELLNIDEKCNFYFYSTYFYKESSPIYTFSAVLLNYVKFAEERTVLFSLVLVLVKSTF